MTKSRETMDARVTANDDPEQRGRIRVACVALLGDEDSEVPGWIEPLQQWGWFIIPDVDEMIEIEVTSGESHDESFMQGSIDALAPKWKGARHYGNSDGDSPTAIHDDFKTNYGKRRGFATPHGHTFVFDDTTDNPTVALTWRKTKDDIEKRSSFTIDKDGNFNLSVMDGVNSFKLEGSGAATVGRLGDAAVKVAIADHLQALFGQQRQWNIVHSHPTGVGESGPPSQAVDHPDWDPKINSSHLLIPDET